MPNQCTPRDIAEIINFGTMSKNLYKCLFFKFVLHLKGIENIPANITNQLPFNLTSINEMYVSCAESQPFDTRATFAL